MFSAGLILAAAVSVTYQPAKADCVGAREFETLRLPSGCLTPTEGLNIRLRYFRADMAVAALTCNQKPLYNRFVSRHQAELVSGGQALRSMFSRLYQSAATKELNRFITHLANQASMRSLAATNYCKSMASIFETTLSLPLRGLTDYVRQRPVVTALGLAKANPPARRPRDLASAGSNITMPSADD